MKSFSICFDVRKVFFLLAVLAVITSSIAAAKPKDLSIEELTNFLLGPEYSQWLVGAVSKLATEEERSAYLRLADDEKAERFIEDFWEARNDPSRPWPQEQPRGTYERRAREADRLYTEGTVLGRRTARGETHILFGPPVKVDYIPAQRPFQGNIEIWFYGKEQAEPGLGTEPPRSQYFFVKMGGVHVFHNPRIRDRRLSRRPG